MLKRIAANYLSRYVRQPDMDRHKIENLMLNCERLLKAKEENEARKVKLLERYLTNRGVDVRHDNDVPLRISEFKAWLSTHS